MASDLAQAVTSKKGSVHGAREDAAGSIDGLASHPGSIWFT